MTFALFLPLAAGIGALAGCDPEPLSIDRLAAEEERVICAREVACGGAVDQATCESTAFLVESGRTATAIAAVKRGTLAYDSAMARRCLDQVTTDCAILPDVPNNPCDEIFKGQVAVGGDCLLDDECAGGGACEIPSCPSACCPGTCASTKQAPVPLGGSCGASGADCVSGAACLDGICAPPRAVGAACQGAWRECAAPAVCLAIPGGTARRPLRAGGELRVRPSRRAVRRRQPNVRSPVCAREPVRDDRRLRGLRLLRRGRVQDPPDDRPTLCHADRNPMHGQPRLSGRGLRRPDARAGLLEHGGPALNRSSMGRRSPHPRRDGCVASDG